MPTDTLDYLLSNPPRYELHADCTPVINELVGAGYLQVNRRLVALMVDSWQLPDGIDITYTLTDKGAKEAASKPFARIHKDWQRLLAAKSKRAIA